mmetsp:Transcript_43727/g.103268  ORF Transcript_43727/g.103268 Transcript_43727/m.103268 type:complete len:538 (+) Transcript_43727:120-1733(+)
MSDDALADECLNQISQEYKYEELQEATDNFAKQSLLGDGTYGAVFKGVLQDGSEVAVKRLSRPMESGFREEVEVLSRVRHPNLVILMGFARHLSERYLVYELLPGGDMCARLQKDSNFTWRRRLSVALDAALGISHLHASRPQVFHRDIKTQNILMDRNGTGKMADFGLALLAKPNCDSMIVPTAAGTAGYADPQYIRSGMVTARTEVYSFGMVLLEVLTGRPPAVQLSTGSIQYQFSHLRGELSRLLRILDARAHWPTAVVEALSQIAFTCIHDEEALRPSFAKIVGQLRAMLSAYAEEQPQAHVQLGPERRSPQHGQDKDMGQNPLKAAGQDSSSAATTASVVISNGSRQERQVDATASAFGSTLPAESDERTAPVPLHPAQQPVAPPPLSLPHLQQRSVVAAPIDWESSKGAAVSLRQDSCSPVAKVDCGGPDDIDVLLPANGRLNMSSGVAPKPLVHRQPALPSFHQAAQYPLRSSGEATGSEGPFTPQAQAKLRLQQEMGFTKHQVDEAFKRCSTAEGAIDWILSPERDWSA